MKFCYRGSVKKSSKYNFSFFTAPYKINKKILKKVLTKTGKSIKILFVS